MVDSIEQHAKAAETIDVSLPTLAALAILDDNEREVLVDHYWLGLTYPQIAAQLGLSKQRVHQLRRRALRKLLERGTW